MSGSLQSHDYVPGMSGLRLDLKTGELEINSGRITAGSLPSDPQLITVTAGSWSEYDLPANALERLAFIGAELEKIPAECRASAEFTTEDISFDRDGSDVRTTLTYQRRETAEEVKARQEKAKSGGTRIDLVGGVLSISHDGVLRAQIGDLEKDEHPAPFVVVDGVTYINEASVEGRVAAQSCATAQLVNAVLKDGRLVVAGINLGRSECQESLADAIKGWHGRIGSALEAGGVSAAIDKMAQVVADTELGKDLLMDIGRLNSGIADQVKEIIRTELMPGGLLHRSR